MVDVPVPLSFPTVLNNPGLVDRLREISLNDGVVPLPSTQQLLPRKFKRGDNTGKRWTRRKDNAGLVGNPHTVPATKSDYVTSQPYQRSTFPEPLPAYLPRNIKAPSYSPPTLDPASANAGRFNIGVKGMRRELRKSGYRTQVLVNDVETAIVRWLREGGAVLDPNNSEVDALVETNLALEGEKGEGNFIGSLGAITEVLRSPVKLVWRVQNPDDAFSRYVVHCCARYYEVVSYSKDVAGHRLTYLLRPNVTRPDFRAKADARLETPPTTDLDYSSYLDSSDFTANSDINSEDLSASEDEPDTTLRQIAAPVLPAIDEASSVASDVESPGRADEWSLVDVDSGDEAGLSEPELALSALSIDEHPIKATSIDAPSSLGDSLDSLDHEPATTPDDVVSPLDTAPDQLRTTRRDQISLNTHDHLLRWDNRRSATSSPSRSPARQSRRRSRTRRTVSTRNRGRRDLARVDAGSQPRTLKGELSFYEYLFG